MSNHLPDYLRMQVNAAPNPKNVVTLGDVRITVITPRLIRIEQGAFTDDATLTVLCRDFCSCEVAVTREGSSVQMNTGCLTLHYTAGQPLETLTISAQYHPTFTWHYGQKPLQNLKGTISTLDCINGECDLEDVFANVLGAWAGLGVYRLFEHTR